MQTSEQHCRVLRVARSNSLEDSKSSLCFHSLINKLFRIIGLNYHWMICCYFFFLSSFFLFFWIFKLDEKIVLCTSPNKISWNPTQQFAWLWFRWGRSADKFLVNFALCWQLPQIFPANYSLKTFECMSNWIVIIFGVLQLEVLQSAACSPFEFNWNF